MTKRSLSPSELPPPKRLHTSRDQNYHSTATLGFENSLYDELVLCIFSHLSWLDLCATQATSRNWARLAGDNELWRKQYIRVYGRTRLRGARGFIGRLDGREVKPLPGRVKQDPSSDRNWKWMFRISSNWKNGRCLVEESPAMSTLQPPQDVNFEEIDQTHIILAGTLTITASSKPSLNPAIIINKPSHSRHVQTYYDVPGAHRTYITALALDQSPPMSGHLSLACFLSTGEFSVFEINPASFSNNFTRKCLYEPSRRTSTPPDIIQAAYYHPLLVTISGDLTLSIYDLSLDTVRSTQTLTSFTSYPPVSLVLSSPSSMLFKLVVAYSVPVYPRHWSVGATELIISNKTEIPVSDDNANFRIPSSRSFHEDYKYSLPSSMSVISTRTIRAFDLPRGWVNENTLRSMREQWGRRLSHISQTQTDGKWVVLAPGPSLHSSHEGPVLASRSSPSLDRSSSAFGLSSSTLHSPTSLQLYRLVLPAQSNSVSTSPPKLNFIRTLHGQTSTVTALALSDGRCVSLGQNGSIWVWDLEGGSGAEVAPGDKTAKEHILHPTNGAVSFDDRRIITACNGKVVVRRFDV